MAAGNRSGMDRAYLALMEDRLAAASADIRTEAVATERGQDGGLKVSRQRLQRSPPALLKYSPAYFTLVSVTGGASLSIMVLTHTEEIIEEVDFKVDLAEAPDQALVDFVLQSVERQVELCPGFQEDILLLSSLQCSQVLIERFGSSIRVRSRDCARSVSSHDGDQPGDGVCTECRAVAGLAGVKRELVESWPDLPEDFAKDEGDDEQEEVERKEHIREILSKVDERKKRGRKAKKPKMEEEEHDEDFGEGDDDWNSVRRKKASVPRKTSQQLPCPEPSCPAAFAKEVALVSHLLELHPGKHDKATEGWVKCTEPGCFHSYKEGVPHYTKHLINHLKNFHPDNPLLLAETGQKNDCSYCGKTFKYNYALKKHIESLHEAPTVPCHICGILLKGQKTLSTHLKSVHEKTTRHHCPEPGCTMTAVNSHHLKDHIAVVHRGQARYVCSVCGKEHGYYKALKHCQDRHKGRFMHPCTLCDKKYLDKVKLTVHMRVHTGEKPYACPICSTRMARLDNLSAHIKKTHGVTWQEAEKMTNTSVKGGALQKPPEGQEVAYRPTYP